MQQTSQEGQMLRRLSLTNNPNAPDPYHLSQSPSPPISPDPEQNSTNYHQPNHFRTYDAAENPDPTINTMEDLPLISRLPQTTNPSVQSSRLKLLTDVHQNNRDRTIILKEWLSTSQFHNTQSFQNPVTEESKKELNSAALKHKKASRWINKKGFSKDKAMSLKKNMEIFKNTQSYINPEKLIKNLSHKYLDANYLGKLNKQVDDINKQITNAELFKESEMARSLENSIPDRISSLLKISHKKIFSTFSDRNAPGGPLYEEVDKNMNLWQWQVMVDKIEKNSNASDIEFYTNFQKSYDQIVKNNKKRYKAELDREKKEERSILNFKNEAAKKNLLKELKEKRRLNDDKEKDIEEMPIKYRQLKYIKSIENNHNSDIMKSIIETEAENVLKKSGKIHLAHSNWSKFRDSSQVISALIKKRGHVVMRNIQDDHLNEIIQKAINSYKGCNNPSEPAGILKFKESQIKNGKEGSYMQPKHSIKKNHIGAQSNLSVSEYINNTNLDGEGELAFDSERDINKKFVKKDISMSVIQRLSQSYDGRIVKSDLEEQLCSGVDSATINNIVRDHPSGPVRIHTDTSGEEPIEQKRTRFSSHQRPDLKDKNEFLKQAVQPKNPKDYQNIKIIKKGLGTVISQIIIPNVPNSEPTEEKKSTQSIVHDHSDQESSSRNSLRKTKLEVKTEKTQSNEKIHLNDAYSEIGQSKNGNITIPGLEGSKRKFNSIKYVSDLQCENELKQIENASQAKSNDKIMSIENQLSRLKHLLDKERKREKNLDMQYENQKVNLKHEELKKNYYESLKSPTSNKFRRDDNLEIDNRLIASHLIQKKYKCKGVDEFKINKYKLKSLEPNQSIQQCKNTKQPYRMNFTMKQQNTIDQMTSHENIMKQEAKHEAIKRMEEDHISSPKKTSNNIADYRSYSRNSSPNSPRKSIGNSLLKRRRTNGSFSPQKGSLLPSKKSLKSPIKLKKMERTDTPINEKSPTKLDFDCTFPQKVKFASNIRNSLNDSPIKSPGKLKKKTLMDKSPNKQNKNSPLKSKNHMDSKSVLLESELTGNYASPNKNQSGVSANLPPVDSISHRSFNRKDSSNDGKTPKEHQKKHDEDESPRNMDKSQSLLQKRLKTSYNTSMELNQPSIQMTNSINIFRDKKFVELSPSKAQVCKMTSELLKIHSATNQIKTRKNIYKKKSKTFRAYLSPFSDTTSKAVNPVYYQDQLSSIHEVNENRFVNKCNERIDELIDDIQDFKDSYKGEKLELNNAKKQQYIVIF